jgi:hypothetical protein
MVTIWNLNDPIQARELRKNMANTAPQISQSHSANYAAIAPELIEAFYCAALFLKLRIEQDGWQWSSNYLREHVRCANGMRFSNSQSPAILRALKKAHPDIAPFIKLKPATIGQAIREAC